MFAQSVFLQQLIVFQQAEKHQRGKQNEAFKRNECSLAETAPEGRKINSEQAETVKTTERLFLLLRFFWKIWTSQCMTYWIVQVVHVCMYTHIMICSCYFWAM